MEKSGDDLFYAAASETVKEKQEVALVDQKELLENVDAFALPTDEEMDALLHVADDISWPTYLIAFVELAERFSFYGSTAVFTNFIQQPLPAGSKTGAGFSGQSGALGQGQRAATGLTTFNNFWCYITPLVGAWVADTYLGRYKTIAYSIAIALVGHILLIVCALPTVIVNPTGSLACLCVAITIMGIGTGGFKSNISPLVAEQQRHTKPFVRATKTGERVIVDPTLTTARIYMWFYFFINIGALVGQIGMTYAEKYVGFWLAYTLPTIVFTACPLVMWFGHSLYRQTPPQGSVLATAFRIWRYASRGKWTLNPLRLYKNFSAPGFFESAKPSNIPTEQRLKWMSFDDKYVDEIRRGFKACEVFVWYPIYWLSYNQIINNLTSQAAVMETHGIPNDVINNLDPFAILILIPVFDIIIYPALNRIGVKVTPIRKITFGFLTGSMAMIWAAVVQAYIYKTSECGNYASGTLPDGTACAPAPLNVWIQSGSYILIAISEIMASITGLEYAYTKAPKNMKSLVMGIFLFTSAIASAIGQAFTSLSADPLLVWNYGTVAVLAFIGGIGFWFTFYHLDQEEDTLNNLQDGKFQEKE